ncbi:MAG: MATE family efflux transporter [Bacteroidota bacterium]|nr:MATE family efflux transporter [Bacteroidota bacterium]
MRFGIFRFKKSPGVKVVRHVYIYVASYFLNAVLSFLSIYLLTNYLGENSTHDYGIINLYSSFISLLTPFISCGIVAPLSVQYYKKTPEEYRQYFTDAGAVTVASLLLFTALSFIFQWPLARFLRVTPAWILVLPLTVWWTMNNEVTMMMYRMKNQPWGFAFFSLGRNVTEIILTIILVIGLQMTWRGRLLSATIAPAMLGLLSIYILNRWQFITRRIDWKQAWRIIWISAPFIFERLSVFVLGNSDKYFIDKFDLRGTDQVGLYSVAAQIASIIFLVILSMNSAYQPYLFQNLAANNREKVKKITWMYIGAAAIVVIGLFISIPILFHFFIGRRFWGAKIYAYYLSGGYFMWAVYNAFLGYLLFHGKNRLILYISISGMAVSVLLNFYMVPHYGAFGAAITSITTYTFLAAICIAAAWKYFK